MRRHKAWIVITLLLATVGAGAAILLWPRDLGFLAGKKPVGTNKAKYAMYTFAADFDVVVRQAEAELLSEGYIDVSPSPRSYIILFARGDESRIRAWQAGGPPPPIDTEVVQLIRDLTWTPHGRYKVRNGWLVVSVSPRPKTLWDQCLQALGLRGS